VPIAVILTVLNEGEAARAVLDSLCQQTQSPDEVVIADGGSRDQTVAVLREYAGRLPLRIVSAPGSNISQGRNAAIRAARGDIVAVTDAGVHCRPDWLARLTAPFADPAVALVAGFFAAAPQTVLETAMGATVLPQARDINPATYLPSSRSVAFRRSAWEAVGGYPDWLDYSEDVIFDLAVRRQYGAFAFVPEALVDFRPRGSLRPKKTTADVHADEPVEVGKRQIVERHKVVQARVIHPGHDVALECRGLGEIGDRGRVAYIDSMRRGS